MTTKDWTERVDSVTRWMRAGAPDDTKPALMGHAWLAVAEIITGQKFDSSLQALHHLVEISRQGPALGRYLARAGELGGLVDYDPVGWGLEVDAGKHDLTGHLVRSYVDPIEGPGGVILLAVDIHSTAQGVTCALIAAGNSTAPHWLGPDFADARTNASLLAQAAAAAHGLPVTGTAARIWLLQRWALTRDIAELMDERDKYADLVAHAHLRVQNATEASVRTQAEWMLEQAAAALVDIEVAVTAFDDPK